MNQASGMPVSSTQFLPFSIQWLRVFYIWHFTSSYSCFSPLPPGFCHHHLLTWLFTRSPWLLMANPQAPFQSFSQKHLMLLTTPFLFPWLLRGLPTVSPIQHPSPFLIMAPLVVTSTHSASTWFGGWPPHSRNGYFIPLGSRASSGMGMWPKLNHWDSNLRFLLKLLGKKTYFFFSTGVAELSEYECGIRDGHLPNSWGGNCLRRKPTWGRQQRESWCHLGSYARLEARIPGSNPFHDNMSTFFT